MKSLMRLWQELAADLSAVHGVSTTRDYLTVTRRVEKEGLSFLTITLPTFASDLERGLELGRVDSNHFVGFHRPRGGCLPAFLSGFTSRIFDAQSGKILDEPCVDSVLAIRQLCYLFKKIEMECTPARVGASLRKFISCEVDLKKRDGEWTSDDLAEFSRLSSLLFGNVFDLVNHEVETFDILPKHGPGATADRLKGNQKWNFSEWTDRLESVFPYVDYAVPNHRHHQRPRIYLTPGRERPVRVTSVPKTQKTPRWIAIEPTCMQFMQQGLMDSLVPKLETMTPSRYFIGFTDQIPNQDLAMKGSSDGSLATLDLSEASDRVSNTLALELFRPWPGLSEAIQATRSRTAVLPSGEKLRLSKFASMGSATCFPVEAMVFTTLAFMGIQDARNHRLLPQDLVRFRGKVRVYGDDIVVPADYAVFVMKRLESFGLKVNTNKSFWIGRFRESCGGDFFLGERVTPIRLGQLPPVTKRDVAELQNWIEVSNSLHFAGFWRAARYAADLVEDVLGKLPCVPWSSDALALKSFSGLTSGELGWDRKLHRPLVKAYVVSAQPPTNEIGGLSALHKVLSGNDPEKESKWGDPLFRDHLVRSGRPSSAYVKKRWIAG